MSSVMPSTGTPSTSGFLLPPSRHDLGTAFAAPSKKLSSLSTSLTSPDPDTCKLYPVKKTQPAPKRRTNLESPMHPAPRTQLPAHCSQLQAPSYRLPAAGCFSRLVRSDVPPITWVKWARVPIPQTPANQSPGQKAHPGGEGVGSKKAVGQHRRCADLRTSRPASRSQLPGFRLPASGSKKQRTRRSGSR